MEYYNEKEDRKDIKVYYKDYDLTNIPDYSTLNRLITETHINKPYYQDAKKYLHSKADIYPDEQLRSIYSGRKFTVAEILKRDEEITNKRNMEIAELIKRSIAMKQEERTREIEKIENKNPYDCEHVVCRAWFKPNIDFPKMEGDIHNLFTCERECNNERGNLPFFDFPDYNPLPDPDKRFIRKHCGKLDMGKFEPEYNKGIVARAVLYFLVRYSNVITVYSKDDINMLISWSNLQPVEDYEKHRNRDIFLLQGNRNPFIDFPSWVNGIKF